MRSSRPSGPGGRRAGTRRPGRRPWAILGLAAQLLAACAGSEGPSDGGVAGADASPDLAAGGDDGGEASITPGARDRVLLVGTVVTPDEAFDGEVLVEGNLLTCVAAGTACEGRPGAAGATVIRTHGVIAPGLIDTHNHILFDIFDETDWTPAQRYQNHDQWPNEPRYVAMLDVKQCLANDSQGKPAWCANTPYGTTTGHLRCEMNKFGELKALVAGTTSVVGLMGRTGACYGSLARSIDIPQNGLGTDTVQVSSLFPPATSTADGVCANVASGKTEAFLVHCGEGTDARSRAEFGTLSSVTTTDGCLLNPATAITHGTAFLATDFALMAQHGMKLIWSPASNVFLYGQTTDIPAARAAGVAVALAPDWSLGGSQNLLDELRFADRWDDMTWGNQLTPKDLVRMATVEAARVLSLEDKLGVLAEGHLADLAVYSGDPQRPFDAILAATPASVRLVMVGGTVLYGDAHLEAAGPTTPGCEPLDVCGAPKFLCAATPQAADKLDQTYAQLRAALEQAMLDVDAQTPGDGWAFAPLAPLVRCR